MLHKMAPRKTKNVKHYDTFEKIPYGTRQVYDILKDLGPEYMDENLQIDISNRELAEMSQVNEKTISNRLRVLEGNGYIESELFFDDDAQVVVRRMIILK